MNTKKSPELNEKHELLLKKQFAELSEDEKVLNPEPSIRTNLIMAMVRQQQEKPSRIAAWRESLLSLFSYRVPAYQVGIAMAMLAVAIFSNRGEKVVVRTEKSVVHVHDTVQVIQADIARQLIDTVSYIVEKGNRTMKALSAPKEVMKPSSMWEETERPASGDNNSFVGLNNLPIVETQKRGRSMAEDSMLLKFSSGVAQRD